MGIDLSSRAFSPSQMTAIARSLLDTSTLCAISTVSPRGQPHVNTAYFGWDADFQLVWLSDPQAQHSRNLRADGTAAVAVFDSHQTWGGPDRGIQLLGFAVETPSPANGQAKRIYGRRFPKFSAEAHSEYRLYVFRPRWMKLFDQGAFGGLVFVTARVEAEGNLTWIKTELYRTT